MLKARRALISVYDKRDVVEFAKGLSHLGIEILSTGGTHQSLSGAGLELIRVSDVTGFPEILDGRVKTLHPQIHGGILADRERASHLTQLGEHGITAIDLVVVNLYPFQKVAASGAPFEEIIEMVDIGGPAMIRGAAKNHRGVIAVVDPDDYPQVLAALEEGGGTVPDSLRRNLAIKAFRHTQSYDAAIAHWLEGLGSEGSAKLPHHLLLDLKRESRLRYGENPHQKAALYRVHGESGVFGGFEKLQGKELSFNNLLDADAARRMVSALDEPAAVVVKHNNPSGAARGEDCAQAYERALACDPMSAFGSVVAVNRAADLKLAEALAPQFVEVVLAPAFTDEALTRLSPKSNLRLIRCPLIEPSDRREYRGIDGGFLIQDADLWSDYPGTWSCPTRRQPTPEELDGLDFAWRIVRHVRSNAIVVTNRVQTVGIGAGQMSRVDSCRLAIGKAELPLGGCVAASDAFFPFRDGLDFLAEAGIKAIVQPGGSKRDEEVIAAADEHGVAMLMTQTRHFRH
ncbi:MAG: bifunctional phosphoribosylaminoimidazolecarboxamide formyltransferase/IMP cyclohydrolase [bacterium]|nr:bifunctional phosphoribosylaminoimidazolecarboxamide formyltransferase/IMP cyclohydrolase [bacterium]